MTMLEDFLKDLAPLVNLDCGTSNTAGVTRAAEIMKAHYESIGFTCELVDLGPTVGKGLLARNKPEAGYYDVMMNAHLDTVFPDGTAAARPLSVDGDRAHGPGCSDCKGDFVPDLTVNYEIINNANNETVGSGTFMQMNASDGPHYGANVKLDEAGSYKLVLKIESPEKKGWMLHVDPETGVKGRFWTEPLEVTFPEWNYTPQEW